MHALLADGASGLRHLRWGREILATLEAHYEHNPQLAQAERELVLREAVNLRGLVEQLSKAVKPYRDFLERERTGVRGALRVMRFVCDEEARRASVDLAAEAPRGTLAGHEQAARLAALTARQTGNERLADAAIALEDGVAMFRGFEQNERLPKKATLRAAVGAFRRGLAEITERLEAALGPRFAASVYPELAPDGARVLDEGDEDDDAAAR